MSCLCNVWIGWREDIPSPCLVNIIQAHQVCVDNSLSSFQLGRMDLIPEETSEQFTYVLPRNPSPPPLHIQLFPQVLSLHRFPFLASLQAFLLSQHGLLHHYPQKGEGFCKQTVDQRGLNEGWMFLVPPPPPLLQPMVNYGGWSPPLHCLHSAAREQSCVICTLREPAHLTSLGLGWRPPPRREEAGLPVMTSGGGGLGRRAQRVLQGPFSRLWKGAVGLRH